MLSGYTAIKDSKKRFSVTTKHTPPDLYSSYLLSIWLQNPPVCVQLAHDAAGLNVVHVACKWLYVNRYVNLPTVP